AVGTMAHHNFLRVNVGFIRDVTAVATTIDLHDAFPFWSPAPSTRDELGPLHSITSSAATSNLSGTVRPSIRAVDALMTSSNFDDCTTGRSAGFVPLRTCPT